MQADFQVELERVNDKMKEELRATAFNVSTLEHIEEIIKSADRLENKNYFKKKRLTIESQYKKNDDEQTATNPKANTQVISNSGEKFFDTMSTSCKSKTQEFDKGHMRRGEFNQPSVAKVHVPQNMRQEHGNGLNYRMRNSYQREGRY